MTLTAERSRGAVLLGSQTPTHRWTPEAYRSRGPEAIELAEIVGLELDQYQRDWLTDGLGLLRGAHSRLCKDLACDGCRWASLQVGIELARQNGKSVGFEVRALAGLFLFRERLITYTAHKGETAMQAYSRIEELIKGCRALRNEVKTFHQSNGKEAIRLKTGQLLRFRTRTGQGGRGMAGSPMFLDEAQDLTDEELAALWPVVIAQPNPQLWFAGSAGGQESTVLGKLVKMLDRRAERLTMWRFAASDDDDPNSDETAAKVNPALGRRIMIEDLRSARDTLTRAKYAREHLTIGDYPKDEGEEWLIPQESWRRMIDLESHALGPVAIGIEVKADQSRSSVSIAGQRADGSWHLEVVENRAGVRWVPAYVKAMLDKQTSTLGVVVDDKSETRVIIGELEDLEIELRRVTANEFAEACGWLYSAAGCDPERPKDEPPPRPIVFHRGGSVLTSSLSTARKREILSGWVVSRRGEADSTPLISAILALFGARHLKPSLPAPAPRSVSAVGQSRNMTADLATARF